MEFIYVILSFVGLFVFIGWAFLVSKKKSGIPYPMIGGIALLLVLCFGAFFFFQNGPETNVTVTKEEKPTVQPQPEESKEEEPKEEETPQIVEEKRIEVINGRGSTVQGPANPKYIMDVTYDSTNHIIEGTMSVEFINNLDVDLSNLYFNVWGNANTYLAISKKEKNVTIEDVKVNGKIVEYSLEGSALHIAQVDIKKTESAKVEMGFSVFVPETQDRFGWNKTTTSLGNWFPILAVYDEDGWDVDPYYPGGDSFYSLSGEFDVTLTTEKEQVIATTGTEIGEPEINGGLATHHYTAKNVRDFAMELDPNYKIKQAMAGEIPINVYYKEEHAGYVDTMLNASIKSLTLFSEKFGQYPWPELDVCAMEGWFGGMEYPQLVMISIMPDNQTSNVDFVTAHEIGHQWFYGIIGNNQYDEPWLDESFASFAAALFDGQLESVDTTVLADSHLSSSIDIFTENAKKSTRNYYMMVYRYGATVLDDLRQELGEEQFYTSMQAYFNEMKFAVSSTADFIRIMEETSNRDLGEFFTDHRVYVRDDE
ncbi:MAG: M1 family aminopeptidase [Neobacillus sp.]